jgi:hypothetical protein
LNRNVGGATPSGASNIHADSQKAVEVCLIVPDGHFEPPAAFGVAKERIDEVRLDHAVPQLDPPKPDPLPLGRRPHVLRLAGPEVTADRRRRLGFRLQKINPPQQHEHRFLGGIDRCRGVLQARGQGVKPADKAVARQVRRELRQVELQRGRDQGRELPTIEPPLAAAAMGLSGRERLFPNPIADRLFFSGGRLTGRIGRHPSRFDGLVDARPEDGVVDREAVLKPIDTNVAVLLVGAMAIDAVFLQERLDVLAEAGLAKRRGRFRRGRCSGNPLIRGQQDCQSAQQADGQQPRPSFRRSARAIHVQAIPVP